MLIWSAKAACSTATIWFYEGVGCRQAAEDLDEKPHTYRREVHYDSPLHQRALAEDLTQFRVLRIVRDPWARAVSSYRHALRWGYHDDALGARLGRPVNRARGYSFVDYLDHLGHLDLTEGNIHDRVQRHPVEDVLTPTTIVRLPDDNLFASLERFEADGGLPITDLTRIEWIERVETRRRAGPTHNTTGPDIELTRVHAAPGGNWPEPSVLLTEETRASIGRLYATDIDAYFS